MSILFISVATFDEYLGKFSKKLLDLIMREGNQFREDSFISDKICQS